MNRYLHIFGTCTLLLLAGLISCEFRSDTGEIVVTNDSWDQTMNEAFGKMYTDPEGALVLLDEVITEAEGVDAANYIGKAKWYKAYVYDVGLKNLTQSYFYYNEALREYQKTEDSDSKAKLYLSLGILYGAYEQYDKSIDSYESGLAYRDDIPESLVAEINFNLGVSYRARGDLESAESVYTEAFEIAQSIDDKSMMAKVNNRIGWMYKESGDYDMAKIAFNNTIRDNSRHVDLGDLVGQAYHGLANVFMETEENEKAIEAFRTALNYKTSSESIFVTKYDMGTVLYKSGQTDKAIGLWKAALNEKHSATNLEHVKIYADLSKALEESSLHGEASSYSKLFTASIEKIITDIERQKEQTSQVMFADIVRQYEEFNKPVPWYQNPWIIAAMILAIGLAVYVINMVYFRYKSSRVVSDVMTELQSEFQQIRVD